ncbi:peptide chain release factor 1 [Listeria rocourtiae FSL F6-920]|nr:peptide chain release factor 1 [Listeria rocourtiae FSL F6-920]
MTEGLAETREMMNEKLDDDMKEMVKEEFNELTQKKDGLGRKIEALTRSKRPK